MPDRGLGECLNDIQQWLDENAGADGWALAPSGIRGIANDAFSIYLTDATVASAFVARWCVGHRAESAQTARS